MSVNALPIRIQFHLHDFPTVYCGWIERSANERVRNKISTASSAMVVACQCRTGPCVGID